MKILLSAAIAALAMAVAPSAGAAQFTSTGYIERIDPTADTVRIRGGDEYRFSPDVDLSRYVAGTRVNIGWNTQNPRLVFEGGSRYRSLVDAVSIQPAD